YYCRPYYCRPYKHAGRSEAIRRTEKQRDRSRAPDKGARFISGHGSGRGRFGTRQVLGGTREGVPMAVETQQAGSVAEHDSPPMTGARVLCQALMREGVDIIFGYPGGAV